MEGPPTGFGAIFMCKLCNLFSPNRVELLKHVCEQHTEEGLTAEEIIVPLRPLSDPISSGRTEEELSILKRKRKRGRPKGSTKKFFVDKVIPDANSNSKHEEKTEEHDDGYEQGICEVVPDSLECQKCNRTFSNSRQLRKHICLIILSEEGDAEGENGSDQDDELDGKARNEAKERTPKKLRVQKTEKMMSSKESDRLKKPVISVVLTAHEAIPGATVITPVEAVPQEDEPAAATTAADAAEPATVEQDAAIHKGYHEYAIQQAPFEQPMKSSRLGSTQLKIFTCQYCNKIFKFKHSLQAHLRIHTNEKPYKCTLCSYASAIKANLNVHMRKHTGEKFSCEYCTFTCLSKGHLKVHIERVHNKVKQHCRFCKKKYSDIKNLLKHIRETHDMQDKKVTEVYNELRLMTREGKRQLLYDCHVCERKFKNELDRDRHMFVHGDKRPFACELCGHGATKYQALELHVRKHPFVYVCLVCTVTFVSSVRLKKHIKEMHGALEVESVFNDSLNQSYCLLELGDDIQPEALGEERIKLVTDITLLDTVMKTEQALCMTELAKNINNTSPDLNKEGEKVTQTEHLKLQELSSLRDVENQPSKTSFLLGPALSKCVQVDAGHEGMCDVFVQTADPPTDKGVAVDWLKDMSSISGQTELSEENQNAQQTNAGSAETTSVATFLSKNNSLSHDTMATDCQPDSLINSVTSSNTDSTKTVNQKVTSDIQETQDQCAVSTMPNDTPPNLFSSNQERPTAFMQILHNLNKRCMNTSLFEKIKKVYGDLECEYCGKFFWYQMHYDMHIRTHTREQLYYCAQCNYSSVTKNCLKRHLIQKHSNILLKCPNEGCDYCTPDKYKLQAHLKGHSKLDGRSYVCPVCGKSFSEARLIKAHIKAYHPDVSTNTISEVLGRRVQLKGLIGKRAVKCPYCDCYFMKNGSDLQRHIWAHEGKKPFKCSVCEYATRSKSNLKAHMNRHCTEKTHLCDMCGKKFKSKGTLKSHKQLHTADGKQFKCAVCDYTTAQKPQLLRHMEQHASFKPFRCAHCHYSCNISGSLRRHYNRKHPNEEFVNIGTELDMEALTRQGAIKCPVCSFIYGTKWELNRHLKHKHRLKLVEVNGESKWEQTVDTPLAEASTQYLHITEADEDAHGTQAAVAALQDLRYNADIGERLDSTAVNILQQIIEVDSNNHDAAVASVVAMTAGTVTLVKQVTEEEQSTNRAVMIQEALQHASVGLSEEHHLVVSSDEVEGIETVTVYTQGEEASEFIVYVHEAVQEEEEEQTVVRAEET
ncbi:zinc finger protein ZFAT [Protopterus annectens]|uniref:zinc finger protein ZFAT n=1 Tax=Protopterus annectens TaxID=7888 RepID=UPI001CF93F83|nr:zinc finger protein ZFAT [Protopterus annectens]